VGEAAHAVALRRPDLGDVGAQIAGDLRSVGAKDDGGRIEDASPYVWVSLALELQWHDPHSSHMACGPDGRCGYGGQRADGAALCAKIVPAAAGLCHHARPQ